MHMVFINIFIYIIHKNMIYNIKIKFLLIFNEMKFYFKKQFFNLFND